LFSLVLFFLVGRNKKAKKPTNLIPILGHYWLTDTQHFLGLLSISLVDLDPSLNYLIFYWLWLFLSPCLQVLWVDCAQVLLGEEADNYDTNSEYTEPRENGKDHRFKNDDYNTDLGTEAQVWQTFKGTVAKD
jgi:hypothetical protein